MQQTVIEPDVRKNHSYDKGHNGGDQERFYWDKVAGLRFEGLLKLLMPTKRQLNGKEV